MPTIIYLVAIASIIIAYIFQIISVIAIIVSIFNHKHDIWCDGIKDLFSSCVQIRNTSYFLLFFVYMISTSAFDIMGVNSLKLIAETGKMYGLASSLTLFFCFFSMIIRTIKNVKSSSIIALIKQVRKSVLFSIITGLIIFYLTMP